MREMWNREFHKKEEKWKNYYSYSLNFKREDYPPFSLLGLGCREANPVLFIFNSYNF